MFHLPYIGGFTDILSPTEEWRRREHEGVAPDEGYRSNCMSFCELTDCERATNEAASLIR